MYYLPFEGLIHLSFWKMLRNTVKGVQHRSNLEQYGYNVGCLKSVCQTI
jgi:hypothetical protein